MRPTRAETEFWEENGYLILESAMVGDDLARLQEAFERASRESKEAWLEGVAKGKSPAAHYDIPKPLERDDAFIDLIDHPSWYPHLMEFANDELILMGPQVRTVPAQPISYVGWHPDVPQSSPLHMKVQIYVDDCPAERGAFAYVPGSHLPGAGPCPKPRPLDSMPGCKVLPGKAGDAIIFNSYGWHTAMENRTLHPRKSIILIYEQWSEGRIPPDRYASILEKCKTPERRRLFSLEPMRA